MITSKQPDEIGVWTEDGRDDGAAEVGVTAGTDSSLHISIDAPKTAITYIALRWLQTLPAGARILGDAWERGYGDLEWRGIVPERPLPWYALVYNPTSETTTGLGVETGPGSMVSWRVDEAGVTLVLDVRCGGRGVQLVGRTLQAATVHTLESDLGETPFAFARRFCQSLCPNPRLPKEPIYGGNDWYSRYGNITAETVQQDAVLIRELAPEGDNPPIVVIDAGWYPTDAHDGAVYERGNAGFPDMAGLAEGMRDLGVRPGIWIRPLLVQEDAPKSWRVGPEHPLAETPGVYLDPSVPEVLARVREDVTRLAGWGYELIRAYLINSHKACGLPDLLLRAPLLL